MIVEELPEFKRDLKALLGRYPTLKLDIEVVKKVLVVSTVRSPLSFTVEQTGVTECMIKGQKMACRAIKGKGVHSGMRLIYALFDARQKIVLIELFHTDDKATEDRQRIYHHFK